MATDKKYSSVMVEELVEILGLTLTATLIDVFGGQLIYFAKNKHLNHPLLSDIDSIKLSKALGGETIAVPKTLLPAKTTKPLILQLAKDNLRNTGKLNINSIAKKSSTTHRWVLMVLSQARRDDDDHLNLF